MYWVLDFKYVLMVIVHGGEEGRRNSVNARNSAKQIFVHQKDGSIVEQMGWVCGESNTHG